MRFTATQIITGYLVFAVIAMAAVFLGTDLLDSSRVTACKKMIELFVNDPRAIEYIEIYDNKAVGSVLIERLSDVELDKIIELEANITVAAMEFYSPNAFGATQKHWVLCGFDDNQDKLQLALFWIDGKGRSQSEIEKLNDILAQENF